MELSIIFQVVLILVLIGFAFLLGYIAVKTNEQDNEPTEKWFKFLGWMFVVVGLIIFVYNKFLI